MSTSEGDDFDQPEDLICANTPMPPNTKKCDHNWVNSSFGSENRKNGLLECSMCGATTEKVSPPSPEKPEHTHITRDFVEGCPACYPPTPAVEDWTKELYRGLCKDCDSDTAHEIVKCTRHTKGLNPIWVNGFIRSLLESDRKRIVEEGMRLEKSYLGGAIETKNQGIYNQAIADLLTFITNLK